ncbi:MAG: DUF697 domain-containing protein [Cyclobacteriaceae bacterium]|nr:DUF697 domain-containing protein [Cyclobacteriaceae bacterium HetDA_MAG_MS6]
MINTLKQLVLPAIILLFGAFVLFLINQIWAIYQLANGINEIFGTVTLIAISAGVIALLALPFFAYLKLPKPLHRPQSLEEVTPYQKALLNRMQRNNILQAEEQVPSKLEDLPVAIATLDRKADKVIRETATTVFLTTSISQNGKLDALTVLITQIRMIWKIAHIYYQRPSLRELSYLYLNVGGSSFLASEIEDLDISKHIEPIVGALFKSASGRSIPVLGHTSTIILDSLLEGSTNAFLSLRVGILTKKYCGQLDVLDKREIRKATVKEAAVQLKDVAVSSSGRIISALVQATKQAGVDTIKSGWQGLKKTGRKMRVGLVSSSRKKLKRLEQEK